MYQKLDESPNTWLVLPHGIVTELWNGGGDREAEMKAKGQNRIFHSLLVLKGRRGLLLAAAGGKSTAESHTV